MSSMMRSRLVASITEIVVATTRSGSRYSNEPRLRVLDERSWKLGAISAFHIKPRSAIETG